MKRWDSAFWTKPSVNGDVIFFPFPQAAVVGDTDILFQFWDLLP